LTNIERLQFSDLNVALDFDNHAGQTVKLLGLLLGKDQATNKIYVGAGLKLLDGGMTYEQLMSAVLDVVLGVNASSLSVVELIWNNLVGPPTPADNISQYSALIDNGTYTSAGLAMITADHHSLNTISIDLVGLAQTGVEYIPYG
jgi:serralysin